MKLCNFIEWSGRENNLGMPNRKFLPKKKLERRKDKPHKRSSSCDCGCMGSCGCACACMGSCACACACA